MPGAPGFTVAAVARRLGMAPATLRTWARRYGLGPSGHEAGHHRRYTEADVARLAQVRRLVLEGRTPAEAAEAVVSAGDPEAVEPRRHGGGNVLRVPADDVVRGLARAALALDHEALQQTLAREAEQRGVIALWEEVIVPVLVAVGERWQTTGSGIEVEHTFSETLIEVLGDRARGIESPVNATPVLLASADEEQHSLPLYALAAALAEHGVRTRLMGARTPPAALGAAIRRTGPAAVFIWSQMPTTGDATQLRELPHLRPAPRVVLGGPGWDREALPAMATWSDCLGHAVHTILESMGRVGLGDLRH
jgi:DNA-binding transcriptional MerR regulator